MDTPTKKVSQKVVVSKENKISIDFLRGIVRHGGKIKPGAAVVDESGKTIINADTIIDTEDVLINIQKQGVCTLHIDFAHGGRLWDRIGKQIRYTSHDSNEKISKGIEINDLFGNKLTF